MGRIATILFAHRLGTSLEPECKMYRLAADVFNDAAMVLDCLSPAFPKASRVFLLSLSSVLRSLCGVAAGSSKASLSAHFATQGNLGELNAVGISVYVALNTDHVQKDSSQETVISLLGMLVGSLVVSRISSQWATWTAMIGLLAVHLGTNYLAVRAVSMRTLNRQRANLVFSTYLEKCGNGEKEQDLKKVPSPQEISVIERVFEKNGVLRWKGGKILGYCKIGVSLRTILDLFGEKKKMTGSYTGSPSFGARKLLDEFQDEDYILWYDSTPKTFFIVLKVSANTTTQLHAWMHALFMARKLEDTEHVEPMLQHIIRTHSELKSIATTAFDERLIDAGWDIETGALETRSGTRIKEERTGST
jgi:hypothetical protein